MKHSHEGIGWTTHGRKVRLDKPCKPRPQLSWETSGLMLGVLGSKLVSSEGPLRPPVLRFYGLLVLGTEPCLHFSGQRTDLPAAPCQKSGSLGEDRAMIGGYCFSKQRTFSFPSVGRDVHT